MTIRVLLIEDHLSLIPGLKADLEGRDPTTNEEIAVSDRVLTTAADAVAFFEGTARHGPDALRRLPVDAVLVDGSLPADRHAASAEFNCIEIMIRTTAIFDAAHIPDAERPCFVLTTASPEPNDVRAFVAYGGAAAIEKSTVAPEALRARLIAIVRGGVRWRPPEPRPLHGYAPGFARYLRGIELATSTGEVATRINAAPSAVTRTKNDLRHALNVAPRASDAEIVRAAKDAGITWIPLEYEEIAQVHGVRPRLTPW